MQLEFGYGQSVQIVDVPDRNLLTELKANPVKHIRKGTEAVRYALDHPVGSAKLQDMVTSGQRVAVITSDISRPLPSYEILPLILDAL